MELFKKYFFVLYWSLPVVSARRTIHLLPFPHLNSLHILLWNIDCTYSHFEQSSRCPICTKTLNENDFTELVIADATSATTDIAKTSLQALFSKQSKSNNSSTKALPLSDLCFSLVRQFDVAKQSTKFLLKQLLMDSNVQGRKVQAVLRSNEYLKNEITNLKQGQSTQRLQFEQVVNDLKNRLSARESTISELQKKMHEKDRMIEQFRRLHSHNSDDQVDGRMPESSPLQHGSLNQRMQHQGSLQSCVDSTRYDAGDKISSRNEPPLRGLMKRQAEQAAQQQAFLSRGLGQTIINRSNSITSSHSRSRQMLGGDRRPFTSASIGSNSIPSTPRVRDLSHSSSFSFSSHENRLNKRRRVSEPASARRIMSPNTAFTLNQGVHSTSRGGQKWSSGGYPRR